MRLIYNTTAAQSINNKLQSTTLKTLSKVSNHVPLCRPQYCRPQIPSTELCPILSSFSSFFYNHVSMSVKTKEQVRRRTHLSKKGTIEDFSVGFIGPIQPYIAPLSYCAPWQAIMSQRAYLYIGYTFGQKAPSHSQETRPK